MSLYNDDLQMLGAIIAQRPMTTKAIAQRFSANQNQGSFVSHRAQLTERVAEQVAEPWPGVPGAMPAITNLGFTVAGFVNAGPTSIIVTANPQRPIKPKRMICQVLRTGAGATAAVTITQIVVDATNVQIGGAPWSTAPFTADAVDSTLDLPPTGRGGIITLQYTLVGAALGVGETIFVTTDMVGPSFLG